MSGVFEFRANKIQTFLGIRLTDLRAVMGETAYEAAAVYFLPHVVAEPLHVQLRDQGYVEGSATPDVVALPVRGYEAAGSMNDIPRLVVRLAHGRDAGALARGTINELAVSPAHVLEQVLNSHVRARLYQYQTTTSWGAGLPPTDLAPAEWLVVFDGYCVAPNRRGTPEDHSIVVHLTHILAGLTYSSSISGTVAAGTGYPAAYNQTALGQLTAGTGSFFTAPAAAAGDLAGSTTLFTDFWGFREGDDRVGVKGFLVKLASGNTFAEQNFRPTLEGAACSNAPLGGANNLALTALDVVEPVGRSGDAAAQKQVTARVKELQGEFDRRTFLESPGNGYYAAGYRYGVPTPFRLDGAVLTNDASRSLTHDITSATVESLGPSSFWDLMATLYPARYQISVCPRATGAVVAPAAPVLAGWWQTIYAPETFDYGDDLGNPVPVRGVVLVSSRAGIANAVPAGAPNQTTPGSTLADGGYDSCQPGVIVYKDMPPWLVSAARFPGSVAPTTINGPRTTTALAAITGAAAATGAPAPPEVPTEIRKTANRLAKALYQHIRLLPRTVSVTTRFRTDIAPGSTIRVEVPTDPYVQAGLPTAGPTYLVGLVTRVVLSVDVDSATATTQIQLGFVRTQGEATPSASNPLYGTSHPLWRGVFYGHPWCDSIAVRNAIGGFATLDR